MSTTDRTDPRCGYCGRPIIGSAIYGLAGVYHPECTHGPDWKPVVLQRLPEPDPKPPDDVIEKINRLIHTDKTRGRVYYRLEAIGSDSCGVDTPHVVHQSEIRNPKSEIA